MGKNREQKRKTFHFTITTNGTLLDKDKIDFINEHMDNVVISLDGRKYVHDMMRIYRNGSGSYDDIVNAARELVKSRHGKSYFVRGTFTNKNLDFSEDIFHIAGLGFDEVSIEPVVGSGETFHITREHIPAILDEYENWQRNILNILNQAIS